MAFSMKDLKVPAGVAAALVLISNGSIYLLRNYMYNLVDFKGERNYNISTKKIVSEFIGLTIHGAIVIYFYK